MTRVLHDGRPCAESAATSRALHYGDGVFRTLLWHQGRAVDWNAHIDKLAADCAALELDVPDANALAAEVADAAKALPLAAVKIVVARRASDRGYAPQTRDSERWVLAYPLQAFADRDYQHGIDAVLSDVRLSSQPLLAGVKHLNRLDQILASRGWPAGAREALMCDAHGRVICGTRSNLFVVRDGKLCTPRLDRCGVAGIMRARIIDCAHRMQLHVQEGELRPEIFTDVQEAFISNALIGIWPLRSVGSERWAAPGPRTRALMLAIAHPLCSLAQR
jgi:4-amino-4-deoxychorismate lyase